MLQARRTVIRVLVLVLCLAPLSAFSINPAHADSDSRTSLRTLLINRDFIALDDAVQAFDQAFSDGTLTERQYGRELASLYEAPAELEPLFQEWIDASTQPMLARMVRGAFYHAQGWRARGGKFIGQTPPQQIERMTLSFDQAQQDLNAVLSQKPDCALCYGSLVNISRALGQSDKKVKLFQQALKQNPKAYWVVTTYFDTLAPQWGGRPDEAQQFLKWFRENYPNNPAIPVIEASLLIEQVDTYVEQNDYSSAQPLVQRALTLDPLHARAWEMQAWMLDQAQDYQGALNAAENALQNGSDSDWTLGQKAQMLVKLGRVEEGIQVLEQAVEEGSAAAFRIGLRVLAGTLHVKSPDYPRMWEFCQRGMKASLPEAFACTGTFYYFGWLKPIDYPTAFKWWKVAADLGVPESMVDIGILYWEGRGTPHDKNQAIAYWLKGAHADDARGVEKLRAHLTPWEFYTRYTLPTFEKEIREGELGDDPMAVSARFAQITWAGPVGNWSITWGLPILLGVILIGLVLIRYKRAHNYA